jgi:hypothetical protein
MRQVSIALPLALAVLAAGCAGAPRAPAAVNVAAAENAEITCRRMLVPASNQIWRVCGTAEQWEKYDRRMSHASQQQLRRLQGSQYTG